MVGFCLVEVENLCEVGGEQVSDEGVLVLGGFLLQVLGDDYEELLFFYVAKEECAWWRGLWIVVFGGDLGLGGDAAFDQDAKYFPKSQVPHSYFNEKLKKGFDSIFFQNLIPKHNGQHHLNKPKRLNNLLTPLQLNQLPEINSNGRNLLLHLNNKIALNPLIIFKRL